MANWQFKIKTTENRKSKWEALPVRVELSDTEDDPDLVSTVMDAILETENAYEVRANRAGSLQGHYAPKKDRRIK